MNSLTQHSSGTRPEAGEPFSFTLEIVLKGVLVQRKFILAIIFLIFSGSSMAADKSEKIRGLMVAQELNATF